MFGCLTNFAIGNKLGRRPMIFLGAIGTLIGAALQTGTSSLRLSTALYSHELPLPVSVDLAMFIVSRLINGFAVGILTSIVPCYIAEISKAAIRGMMMSLELVFCASGLMTAFWVS